MELFGQFVEAVLDLPLLSIELDPQDTVIVWLTSQAEDRVKEEDPKNGRKTAKSFYKRKSLLQGIMNTPYKQYVFDR